MSFPDAMRATVGMGRGDWDQVVLHQGWKRPDPTPGEVPTTYPLSGIDMTQPLIDAALATTHLAAWKRIYGEDEVGADFRNRHGYYELFGPTGHLARPRPAWHP